MNACCVHISVKLLSFRFCILAIMEMTKKDIRKKTEEWHNIVRMLPDTGVKIEQSRRTLNESHGVIRELYTAMATVEKNPGVYDEGFEILHEAFYDHINKNNLKGVKSRITSHNGEISKHFSI